MTGLAGCTGDEITFEVSGYDAQGRLVSVYNDNYTVSYTYNHDGLRASKTVTENGATTVTKFLYNSGYIALELDGAGAQTAYNVFGGSSIISRTTAQGTDYYLYNGRGDVVQLTNSAGNVTATYDYDAFGNLLTVNDHLNPFRYCGEYWDYETKRYYFRARYYSPATGRFTQRDKFLGFDTDPLSLNRYTYTHNNPVRYTDPTGYWEEGDEEYDQATQDKIAKATSDYYIAASKNPPDRDAMNAARASANAAREAAKTKSKANITPTGQAYSDSIATFGSYNADRWASAVAFQAIKATVQLNSNYLEVNEHLNANLLYKEQGPNTSQYFALYNYWYICNTDKNPVTGVPRAMSRKLTSNVSDLGIQVLDTWWVDTSGRTLEDAYKQINAASNRDDPIFMQISGDTVNITANLWIYGDGANATNSVTSGRPQMSTAKYRDLVISGMQSEWSGRYWIEGRWVTVNVSARNNNTTHANSAGNASRYVNVQVMDETGRARGGVEMPEYWSRATPGGIILFTHGLETEDRPTDAEFKKKVAHEFGHILGMDDAYEVPKEDNANWTRNSAPVEKVPIYDIMRGGTAKQQVSALDIMMALDAFKTNQVQFFPGKWGG